MGKGGSSSSEVTTQTITETKTENYDQRVGAEGGGVALGAGATLQYAQEFGPEVAAAFNELIDFAREAGAAIIESNKAAISHAEKSLDTVSNQSLVALEAVSARLEGQEQPQKNFFVSIFPYLIVVGVVIMIVVALTNLTKKKIGA